MMTIMFEYNNFDEAYADSLKATVLPLKRGVRRPGTEKEVFWNTLKTSAHFFLEEQCGGKMMPYWGVYAGDLWIKDNYDWISDYYKDVYGVRPHFDNHILAMMVGLSTIDDIGFRWSFGSLEDYADRIHRENERIWEAIRAEEEGGEDF